jgi:hypothetical protein
MSRDGDDDDTVGYCKPPKGTVRRNWLEAGRVYL